MDAGQKKYYRGMIDRGRGTLIIKDGHLVGLVTYFVGDDDEKYLTHHTPWTIVDDDPEGKTLYIDQFLTYKGRSMVRYIHKEFTRGLKELKIQFPNITTAKWVRVGAQFRKHGNLEGVTHGKAIHCKNITF